MHLCSNKIALDNYASLQMISEYFSVRGRPLNHVKKAEFFRGIRLASGHIGF